MIPAARWTYACDRVRAFMCIRDRRFVTLIFATALITPVTAQAAPDCHLWDRSFYFESNDMSPVQVKLRNES